MRIGFLQFGDFREAFHRLRETGEETYYAQRYSVDFAASLVRRAEFVGVCAMLGNEAFDVEIADRLQAACVPLKGDALDFQALTVLLDRWRLTHLILQIPDRRLLKWALGREISVLPVFADSWNRRDWRSRLNAVRLAGLLRDARISVVGNHNVPASLATRRIGVAAEKIVPWDWPHELTPDMFPTKRLPRGGRPRIVYVGKLIESKGVGDCFEAARMLKTQGVSFRMQLIGNGDYAPTLRRRIQAEEMADVVDLPGPMSHDEAVSALKSAAISIIPSHHRYPEGLPMTIYESLVTRTPMVVSDHPMFRGYFESAPSTRMVREKDPAAIAAAVMSFIDRPSEYEAASRAASALWTKIVCPLTWGDLIETWLQGPKSARESLKEHLLSARLAGEAASGSEAGELRAA